MYSTSVFESSVHCKPSPDGKLIATLSFPDVSLRSTKSLQLINVVKLGLGSPSGTSSASPPRSSNLPSITLLWAPSSTKFLVSTADKIQVFAAKRTSSFHATICNPLSTSGKPSVIQFGARDTEILVWSSSGVKLMIFDLCTSKAVEIANPKFCQPSSASRGLSIRPKTGHLALLTRTGGKDLISIHHPNTRQVQRSWIVDTVDAQGLMWVSGGHWLLVWESPCQGQRILLYTADGQHFRTLGAANLLAEPNADLELGIKVCQPSPDENLCAIGDHSRGVAIIQTDFWRASTRLLHPVTITPRDTLQVWQEQITTSFPERRPTHTFVKATQPLSPPGPSSADNNNNNNNNKAATDLKPGCSMAAYDASSTLLATRLDDSPCALWIWDVAAAELRAVLIFHSSVSFQWHATSRELLLVTYQDAMQPGMGFIWDPLSDGPTPIAPEEYLPHGKETGGKTQMAWVNDSAVGSPVLFVSNAQSYVMLSLLGSDQGPSPWQKAIEGDWDDEGEEIDEGLTARLAMDDGMEEETSEVDDTFVFKRV